MSKEPDHFNQTPRRKAEFIRPPNTLKAKVGSGGLSEEILNKAQTLLENNAAEFGPLADLYFTSLMRGVEMARLDQAPDDNENVIAHIIYPAMQLKANGGMFHYQLVTRAADKLIQFLEVIEKPDEEALEIVVAFLTTIRAIVNSKITGDGGRHGRDLIDALNHACMRYFEKHPGQRKDIDFDYIHKVDDQTP
ncbi:MAG: hypothetical protein JWO78_974 [Micavibrio sp.]|nr:hypothetical protein [Micavibrio sp.]